MIFAALLTPRRAQPFVFVGLFVDAGAIANIGLVSNGQRIKVAPGSGRYRIASYTLILSYDDGQVVKAAAMLPSKTATPAELSLATYVLSRRP